MDYTTRALVKAAMDSTETYQDTVIDWYVTAASRAIDNLCTSQPGVADYFKLEAITDEILTNAVVDSYGVLTCFPHKPRIASIESLSYRFSMRDSWQNANLNWAMSLGEMVKWEGNLPSGSEPLVKISYTGGLAASVDALPKSFVDLATMLVVRFFKEARTGYGDSIGVAELGTLKYTEAFPVRLIETLQIGEWTRMSPWI
jgi:hypothetical protein